MTILNDGMNVIMKEQTDTMDRVVWEMKQSRQQWVALSPANNIKLEKAYKTGRLYQRGYFDFPNGDYVTCGDVKISSYIVSGFESKLLHCSLHCTLPMAMIACHACTRRYP